MKFFLATTLALFAGAHAASAQSFGVVAMAKDGLKHNANDCLGDDTFISNAMNEAILSVDGELFGNGDPRG